jgi:hypothetical protein
MRPGGAKTPSLALKLRARRKRFQASELQPNLGPFSGHLCKPHGNFDHGKPRFHWGFDGICVESEISNSRIFSRKCHVGHRAASVAFQTGYRSPAAKRLYFIGLGRFCIPDCGISTVGAGWLSRNFSGELLLTRKCAPTGMASPATGRSPCAPLAVGAWTDPG